MTTSLGIPISTDSSKLALVQPAAPPQPRASTPLRREQETGAFGLLRGWSAPMREIYRLIERVAPSDATAFLTGETGTGKEVVARTIHGLSNRAAGAFVALNCGAVSASLIESELFGHEQGSFTGAHRRHAGVFEQADKGTLFLDEVTEMAPDLQVKLLRVLETGFFQRVGGERAVHSGARIIAASNRDALAAVKAGRLREDLYYRLQVFPIALPPLRERAADIELLANHFLDELNAQAGTHKRFGIDAISRLQRRRWPGNVRELKHAVQRGYLLADADIEAPALQADDRRDLAHGCFEVRVGSSIAAAEQQLIVATMRLCDDDKQRAAKVLGISLKTLYCRLNMYAAIAPK